MTPVEVTQGASPLVLGMPHTGTFVPPDIWEQLNETGRRLTDTDWHIDSLYKDLLPDVTVVRATHHRFVIDANRDPAGGSLYPGQNTTDLVPLTDFDGQSIWQIPPNPDQVMQRTAAYHAPYHAALTAQMERVRALHGVAVLYDCHSIRSRIPFLFDGTLPDLNIGTNSGASCAPQIADIAHEFAASSPYSTVLNGRFKGGWTTRHYGRPAIGWHAIQMEIAQSAYLTAEAAPWTYSEEKAANLRRWLRDILQVITETATEIAA